MNIKRNIESAGNKQNSYNILFVYLFAFTQVFNLNQNVWIKSKDLINMWILLKC